MRRFSLLAQYLTALRTLVVFTVVLGIAYPLAIAAVAQIPGVKHRADGSLITLNGKQVGSALIGQAFTDSTGKPLVQYFQSRPSAAGEGYDPTATGASNLGPESVVDTLSDPAKAHRPSGNGAHLSLLSDICSRSLAVGRLEDVSGARPYCTNDGLGAVLGVFRRDGSSGVVTKVVSLNQECPAVPFARRYDGVTVQCATFGADYSKGIVTPVRGLAPDHPDVPADAVTASGSGLDGQISPAYADLQAPRVSKARGISLATMRDLIARYTSARTLGFMGEPGVNVLELNVELDRRYPTTAG